MDHTAFIIAITLGYFLGSIPFGLFISKLGGQGDVREIGSGNIGATNVLRTGRKDLAALTLLFDGGKAAISALVIHHFFGAPYHLIAAASALIGHCFPVWLGFKGGKGVATFFGALLATAWPVGLIAAGTWLVIALAFKMSSMAALWAAGTAPLVAFYLGYTDVAVMAIFIAIVIFIRHRENIGRIAKGKETKIGQK